MPNDHLAKLEAAGYIHLAKLHPELEYIFRHALVHDAAYESLLKRERARIHRQVAVILEQTHRDELRSIAAELARHYRLAGERERASDYYRIAGEHALEHFANQEAAQMLHSALALADTGWQRSPVLPLLGEALYRQAKFAEASGVYQQAMDLALAGDNLDGAARFCAEAARVEQLAGHEDHAIALVEDAFARLGSDAQGEGFALLLHQTAALYFNSRFDEGLRLCQQALALAIRLGSIEGQVQALTTMARYIEPENRDNAIGLLLKAAKLAETDPYSVLALRAHHLLRVIAQNKGDMALAMEHGDRHVEIARRRGVPAELAGALNNAVVLLLEAGRFAEAEQTIEEVEILCRTYRLEGSQFYAAMHRLYLLRYRGELEEVVKRILPFLNAYFREGNLDRISIVVSLLADVCIELNRCAEASDALERLIALHDDHPEYLYAAQDWCQLASAYAGQERFDEAHAALERAGSLLTDTAGISVSWHLAHGDLAFHEGRYNDAIHAYTAAADDLGASKEHWARARRLLDVVRACLKRAQPEDIPESIRLLKEAQAVFDRVGAPVYSAQVADQLAELQTADET